MTCRAMASRDTRIARRAVIYINGGIRKFVMQSLKMAVRP
jgi:hypothetical protein